MRHFLFAVAIAVGFAGLGGCSHVSADCSSADAQAATIAVIKDQLEKATRDRIDQTTAHEQVLTSKIRATISQLKLLLTDIRTSKKDPNSTKRFCTAHLKVTFPDAVIQDASAAREAAKASTIAQLADQSDIEREANAFVSTIDFDVQPTDEGDKVYSEIETPKGRFNFHAELLASHLLRSLIESAKTAEQQAAEAEKRKQQAAQAEEQAARNQQAQADLDQAKAENKLAVQSINAIWAAIPRPMRARLGDLQRAWVRKKNADCVLAAASASVDPLPKEAARLRCDTREQQERSSYLRQFVDTSGGTSPPPGM
jgi:uncharacterized protein YecT (DUF1311 family)